MTGTITIRGARTHNLRDVSLDLPLGALVVLAGRSGSGKSSLAFDTVHAEGQRRYLEALSTRLREAIGTLPRPDVDVLHGLPPTVALAQHEPPPSARSTVGTTSEIDTVLRVLFGRAGVQRCPVSGEIVQATPHDVVVARILALPPGARVHVEAPVRVTGSGRGVLDEIARAGFSRVRVGDEVRRLEEVRPDEVSADRPLRIVVDRLKIADPRRDRVHDAVRTATRAGGGVVVVVVEEEGRREELVFTDRPYSFATGQTLPELGPALFRAPGVDPCPSCEGTGQQGETRCPVCGGTGLGPVARAVTYEGHTWPEVVSWPLGELAARAGGWTRDAVTEPLLAELCGRLAALVDVGLSHLTLLDPVQRLSSGELQRLRLARQVGADLSGVLYVLDEPTTGLHPVQVVRLVDLLRRLVARGNGVLVVEHHPDVIAAADRVIEFGPGPGAAGGRVIFEGTPEALRRADTPTGRWLSGGLRLQGRRRTPAGWIELTGAAVRNLRGDPVRIARGVIDAVVGPSGSGKTAVIEALHAHLRATVEGGAADVGGSLAGAEGITRVLLVDALSARRSRRSVPATYVGLWDVLRELLAATAEARVRALEPAAFSLNVPGGRCEACEGLGVRRVDLHFLPEVDVPCEVCEGRRFARDVLEVRWKGLNAAEILALSADEALPVLAGHPRLEEGLRALRDVGLGYVGLGQPAHTLSGGEARRLKLARELVRASRRGAADTVFLLDEPTAGLHPEDVAVLHDLLERLADDGATVVVATHHGALAAACDHVLVLGPGVGPDGGCVLASGRPEDVLGAGTAPW